MPVPSRHCTPAAAGAGATRRLVGALVLAVSGLLATACSAEPEPARVPGQPESVPGGAQSAVVDRVVDGDTLRLHATGDGGVLPEPGEVTVRLLEVDTPESVRPGHPVECYGPQASAYLTRLTPIGARVWVLDDVEPEDRYGRSLLYVWTFDGRFVNREIVRTGHGRSVLFEPNDAYIDDIRDAEREARADRRGLWGACRSR